MTLTGWELGGLLLGAVAVFSLLEEIVDRRIERRRMRLFAEAWGLEVRPGESWAALRARVAARSAGLRRSVS